MAPKADPQVVFRVLRKLQNASVAREGLPDSEGGGRAGENCSDAAGRWTSQPLWTNRRIIRAGTPFGEGQAANSAIADELKVSRPTVLALRAAFGNEGLKAVTGVRRRKR